MIPESCEISECELPPRAAALIEAMRDIGYRLETAVADIVDNSITAGANKVTLRGGWNQGKPYFAIVDDGSGMTAADLSEAMRPGSQHPKQERSKADLGRFGLGLKTASFSQCRKLSVVSRVDGVTSARIWDLNYVEATDRWACLIPNDSEVGKIPCVTDLGPNGTLVVWEELDRLHLGEESEESQAAYNELLISVREHLELVFHRFLQPEKPGQKRLLISMNYLPLEPFDPFNSTNPTTIHLTDEQFLLHGQKVRLQPYILPHHSKVSPEEYAKFAGPQGYLRNQGFYVYRNRRLIIYGTWFRMARQEELTKLARVQVDIPNTLDHYWTIDVRKSRATPPDSIKRRLRILVERIKNDARRPYHYRGRVTSSQVSQPVWNRLISNNGIRYELNPQHPIISSFTSSLARSERAKFQLMLKMIGLSFPASMLLSDLAGSAEKIDSITIPEKTLEALAKLLLPGFATKEEFIRYLNAVEPFSQFSEWVENFADAIFDCLEDE